MVKSPGVAPFCHLGLRPLAGAFQQLRVTWHCENGASVAGAPCRPAPATPPLRLLVGTEVQRVSPVGDIEFVGGLEQAELLGDSAPHDVAGRVQAALPLLRSTAFRGQLSAAPRKRWLQWSHSSGAGTPPPELEQLVDILVSVRNHLPNEAVGAGAVWELPLYPLQLGTGPGVLRYTVVACDDSRWVLRFERECEGLPWAAQVRARTSGALELSPNRLLPVRCSFETVSDVTLGAVQVKQLMRVNAEELIAPALRPAMPLYVRAQSIS